LKTGVKIVPKQEVKFATVIVGLRSNAPGGAVIVAVWMDLQVSTVMRGITGDGFHLEFELNVGRASCAVPMGVSAFVSCCRPLAI